VGNELTANDAGAATLESASRHVAGAPSLRVTSLRKSFGSNEVLGGIDLVVEPGEFVGLMGANGAGKSTLIKILAGLYTRSSGEIEVGGKSVSSLAESPQVAFIHQDLGLVDDMTILENLMLGRKVGRGGALMDRAAERAEAERALSFVRLDHAATTLVRELSPGEKALVAIARSMGEGASLLFVDEATSTLPPAEASQVLEALADVVRRGGTVVMVTHKLSEILDSTGRIVMLIDGHVAADRSTTNLDRAALVDLLASHDQAASAVSERGRPYAVKDQAIVTASGVSGGKLSGMSLGLRRGEVLGVTGVPGSGLYDLAFLMHGLQKPDRGTVTADPGVKRALVPPHRETQGGFNNLHVKDNVGISALHRWRRAHRLIDARREKRESFKLIKELDVRPLSLAASFGTLSGGNKQKVVFGRVLADDPDVLVLCEPTRGVDVQTRAALYELILDLRDAGKAVLIVTSDAEDLFAVCDQVSVVADGELGPFKPVKTLTTEDMEALL